MTRGQRTFRQFIWNSQFSSQKSILMLNSMASKQRNIRLLVFVDDELYQTSIPVHVELQITDVNMDAGVSNCTCEDQGGMDASPETTEDNNPTEVGYNPTDIEELCFTIPSVPASETELDMVDPEGVPGPSSSEQEPVITANQEVDISDAMNPTEVPEVTKIGKFFSFCRKLFGFSAQPETDPDLLSVSEESDYESASEMEEVDMELSCVPEPETELVLVDPEGVPVPRSFGQEPVFRETLYVDLIKPHTSYYLKSSALASELLQDPAEPSTEEVESSSGIDQGGMNASPEIPLVDRPTVPEMWRMFADVPMIYKFSAQHQTDPDVAEMISVSEASDYKPASEMEEVDMEQSCVPEPETELDLVDPEGVPVPRSFGQEPVYIETLYVDLIKPHTSYDLKSSALASELLQDPAKPEVWNISEDVPMAYEFLAQHQTDPDVAEMISVSEPSDCESAYEMDEVDMEQSCAPKTELELDLVDPEGVPGPSYSEQKAVFRETLHVDLIKPHTSLNLKRSVLVSKLVKDPAEPSTEEVESSSGIDQGGMNASPEIPLVDRPTEVPEMWKMSADVPMIYKFSAQHQTDSDVAEMISVSEASDYEPASEMNEVDMELSSCAPEPELELDLVDPEGVPGPSSSEQEAVFRETLHVDLIKPHTSFNLKRSVLVSKLVKDPAEPSTEEVESSSGIDQGGMNASPEIPLVDGQTEVPEMWKMSADFPMIYKLPAQHQTDSDVAEMISVSEANDYESASEIEEVDMELSRVSEPETELDLVDPEGVPVSRSFEQEPVFRETLYVGLIKHHTFNDLKSSALASELLQDPAEPSTEEVESSSGINQGGMNASPEIPQVDGPTGFPKVKIIRKIGALIRKRFRFLVQPKMDPAVEIYEVDTEQTSVSDPEAELDLVDPEGVPHPSSLKQKPVFRETLHVDRIKPRVSFNLKRSVLVYKPEEPLTEEVESNSGIDQDGMNASPKTTQVYRPTVKKIKKIGAFIQKHFRLSAQPETVEIHHVDTEQTTVPEPEAELDLVDPEGVPGPSGSEKEPVPTESMDVNITDAMNPRESTKVSKISKICAFFKKLHGISAKLKTKHDAPQRLSVPDASTPDVTDPTGPLNTSVTDEDAVDYSPETPEDHRPTGIKEWMMNKLSEFHCKDTSPRHDLAKPGPSSLPSQKQLEEIFDFEKLAELLQVEDTVNKCKLPLSPFTEVWRNVYIGDEETARNRRKLMELGVTHILNAAAPKMAWLGKLSKSGVNGKILTGPEYYEGMDIKYCGLPTTYDQSRIIRYFWPAGKFIKKALRNPDNVLFIHCRHGVSHAPTLFVAYLMMYYQIPLEEALSYVTRARRIRLFTSFLLQLSLLEPKKKKEIQQQKGIVIYN
ncbi:uncharacterized protein isoform X3 [Danio rerio]|uniref:Uncharacterized protein isoform X3 n=1 Tax=Danio rerio TaxID=7955 RepID=A0AC58IMJ1_DANRE